MKKPKLAALNLGWVKVIGEEKKRTKKVITIENVLEIKLQPEIGKFVIIPIDYPINYDLMEFMSITEYKFEYSKVSVESMKEKYYATRLFMQTGRTEAEILKESPVQ